MKYLLPFLFAATLSAQTMSIPGGSITTTGNTSPQINSGSGGSISFAAASGNIFPALDNTYAFGTPTNRWADIEATAIVLGGDGTNSGRPTIGASGTYPNQGIAITAHGTGSHTIEGDVFPTSSDAFVLGGSIEAWEDITSFEYDLGGGNPATITGTGGMTVSAATGTLTLSGNQIVLGSTSGNVIPTADNTYAFGTPTNRWADIEATAIVLGGDGTNSGRPTIGASGTYPNQGIAITAHGTGVHTVTGNFVPTSNNSYALGSTSDAFSEVYSETYGFSPANSSQITVYGGGILIDPSIDDLVLGAGGGAVLFNLPNISTGPLFINVNSPNQLESGGAGTSGLVWTSGGSGTNPSWQSPVLVYPLQAAVYLTAGPSIATGTETVVNWSAADANDSTMWSSGSPAIFTVPSGAKRIQLSAQVIWNTTTTGYGVLLKIKGSTGNIYANDSCPATSVGSNFVSNNATTTIIDLSAHAETWFEITVEQNSGSTLTLSTTDTRFSATVFK